METNNNVPRPNNSTRKNTNGANSKQESNSGISPKVIKDEAELKTMQHVSDELKQVLATKELLKQRKSKDINFSDPVIKQGENAVIFPNTINVIQGQAGVHKSRLAATICAAFLKKHESSNDLLGFKRSGTNSQNTIVYVDTERNLFEQLPYALQSIQLNAGYGKADNPENFEYISLLEIDRNKRFCVLEEYLEFLKQNTKNPLFIVLDISTDCIEDFNRIDKSMELIDLMNKAINTHNVMFLCLIHENPKSDKARGHFGTELMNKASTVIQVSFEKDASQNDTDIIRVKYLKCRSTAKHQPFYIQYCDVAKGLILSDTSDVNGIVNNRKHKATVTDLLGIIQKYLGDGSELKRTDLIGMLCKDSQAKERTIEDRLKEIFTTNIKIPNENGQVCKLHKEIRQKVIYYSLKTDEIL